MLKFKKLEKVSKMQSGPRKYFFQKTLHDEKTLCPWFLLENQTQFSHDIEPDPIFVERATSTILNCNWKALKTIASSFPKANFQCLVKETCLENIKIKIIPIKGEIMKILKRVRRSTIFCRDCQKLDSILIHEYNLALLLLKAKQFPLVSLSAINSYILNDMVKKNILNELQLDANLCLQKCHDLISYWVKRSWIQAHEFAFESARRMYTEQKGLYYFEDLGRPPTRYLDKPIPVLSQPPIWAGQTWLEYYQWLEYLHANDTITYHRADKMALVFYCRDHICFHQDPDGKIFYSCVVPQKDYVWCAHTTEKLNTLQILQTIQRAMSWLLDLGMGHDVARLCASYLLC